MVCYEGVVKNVVDIAIFLHNNFIFSCDCFQYDLSFLFWPIRIEHLKNWENIEPFCCVNILLFWEALQIEQTKNKVLKLL